MSEDLDLPKATTVGHRGFKTIKTFIWEDFDPPEEAPNIEFSARKKCDLKKGCRAWVLGRVQDQARPSAHIILAWV